MDLTLVVWSMFVALLAFNILDYATTYIALRYCMWMGPEWGQKPLWKLTRPGRWLRRRRGFRWIKPPKWGYVYWYDHELNPLARGLCKKMGLHGLTVLKTIPLTLVGFNLAAITAVGIPFHWSTLVVFYVLCEVYVHVVWHNFGVVAEIEAEYKKRIRKRKGKLVEEDPLLPI